jgi:hypothetical protein
MDSEVDRTVVTERPANLTQAPLTQAPLTQAPAILTQAPAIDAGQETVRTDSRRITRTGPGNSELTRRIVVLLFGLIQLIIGLRFVLLLLDAREANGLVSAILNVSQLFVAPFEGILRTNNLHAAGSVFDVAAVVAFVGWSIIELVVLRAVGIFRREPA